MVQMMEYLIYEIMGPVARRLGTAVGTFLGGYGVAEGDVNAVVGGVVALVGIGVDLGIRLYWNKRVKK